MDPLSDNTCIQSRDGHRRRGESVLLEATPGINKELSMPTYAYLVRAVEILLESSGKITNEDRRRLEELRRRFEMLYKGVSL
jgi:hypothetical protein